MRRRFTAGVAIVSYVLAVLVVPVLHRWHHLLHGSDHVHTAAGTVYDHEDQDDDDDDDHDHRHDDHDHHHEDPGHGDGSLEHALLLYLNVTPIVLAPPAQRLVTVHVESTYVSPSLQKLRAWQSRGPPTLALL
jgi:ABC-type Zn2+ transport system substrate-binding protein/surface adhesin